MIDSSLPDVPWDDFDTGSEQERDMTSWNDNESVIDEDPWGNEAWDDSNLSESLTLKYLGPGAVRVT